MILVTGGTGLVGSHILLKLTSQGHLVRATKRSNSDLKNVQKIFDLYAPNEDLFQNISWVNADLTDIPELILAFEGVTKVFHCAAMISFDPRDRRELRDINITGTANIVNLCLDNNIEKIVYVSSIAALGESETELISERTNWNPENDNSMYAITKYGGEMEVWRGTQEGLNAVIVNPGVILGDVFFDSGSGAFLKKIKNGLKYYGQGTTGFVDVQDVAEIMVLLMNSNIVNEQYILVSENWSYEKLFKSVRPNKKSRPISKLQLKLAFILDQFKSKLLFTRPKLHKAAVVAAQKKLRYDNSKIKKDLNFLFKSVDDTLSTILKSKYLN